MTALLEIRDAGACIALIPLAPECDTICTNCDGSGEVTNPWGQKIRCGRCGGSGSV